MKRIAISGNIASGKSAVQKVLEDKGYLVLDTDKVAHELLTVKNKVLYDNFKSYDVFENGEFSRQKLGTLIFANAKLRNLLNSIMHPQIAQKIELFFEQNKDKDLLFVGIPLLFEARMENLFDKIIFVYTRDEIRLKRLIKRNNYDIEHAKARINSQISQDEKIKKSDYILNNDGSLKDLELAVIKLLEQNLES